MIEGITGLVAVVMMLTIGRWLHSKSNTANWNNYVGRQVDGALAKGNLWSLSSVAALAILREGAETTIFYVGMAPSIKLSQLLLGIGCALIILGIVGYAMIALSAKLPIAAFFRTATILIYYLVFRFLGRAFTRFRSLANFLRMYKRACLQLTGLACIQLGKPCFHSCLSCCLLCGSCFGTDRQKLHEQLSFINTIDLPVRHALVVTPV